MENKLVVLDIGNPELLNNRVFDPALAKKISHTFLPICYLFQEAKKQGIQLVTPDVFLNLKTKPSNTLLISHLTSQFTEKLIDMGVNPAILMCQESPIFARKFYFHLRNIARKFRHVFLFKGCEKRINKKNSIFHEMHFPQPHLQSKKVKGNWDGKKGYLVMINRNPQISKIQKWGSWTVDLINFIFGFKYKCLELERLKAIQHFSKNPDFSLFGRDWEKPISFISKKFHDDIRNCCKGPIEDKMITLRNYKFSLCFENAEFEGYVTEKIFDSLFAGCIPIYLGAPDIKDYVPENVFIDFRKFMNYKELEDYLKTIDEKTYNQFIKNINKFIKSDAYYNFTQERFAKDIISILNSQFSST